MKKMENYRWIIPSLVALGVILLSGGIFLGVKSYETLEASNSKIDKTNQKSLSGQQKFKLDEYCQIWLQDDNEIPVMLGKVNEDLLNKTEDEIKAMNDEGKTIVMVTHEPDIAQQTKRILVMRDGKLVSDEWR